MQSLKEEVIKVISDYIAEDSKYYARQVAQDIIEKTQAKILLAVKAIHGYQADQRQPE